jgi:hypothetical protein
VDSNTQREQQLVARLHKLMTNKQASIETRESDPDLGISVIKVTQGKTTINVPLLNNSLNLNRNKF